MARITWQSGSSMRLKFLVLGIVAALALAPTEWIASPSAALAASCPSSFNYDWVSENWSNGNTFSEVDGVRAPIKTRLDGTVCAGGPVVSEDSAWIALEPENGSAITQIGFIHQSIPGGQEYCKFWAVGSGAAHDLGVTPRPTAPMCTSSSLRSTILRGISTLSRTATPTATVPARS
jgi:hypothetical protein